ncbi:diheme cytochrome c [Paucibacter sp. DJ1R-11]|uniref:diheme cytochrome c n=1 Tax=unclassified Roseateles TaxID=2626991 RepID=UPI0021E483E8|nr:MULTISPECIES: diheme cytochrome c [unclassified Roseateles]MCV2362999.1 diheme cytochrome c [Paucibacter sp. DJ1R-11]MCV2419105.1 diheme cytochrome c [Paucibacter sp. DJ4R-1]MCV2437940.1 diheme cytochrome c [Paucibacter sp. DJ2R-2]
MKTRFLFLCLALAPVLSPADEGRRLSVPLLPAYQQECAACHIAYPPGLLPAASWQRISQNLAKHYGSDASLDPATVAQLSQWLTAHAGSGGKRAREAPPEDRITRSAWFIREHDEVPAATWKRASIKSAANCAACHGGAEQGDFNEHRIRIPK